LEQFAETLAPIFGVGEFTFERLLNPPKPDALCYLNGHELHVEVAHVYGSESDAKVLLGRKGESVPTGEQLKQTRIVPLDIRILTPLNKILINKAGKNYETNRVWLLVRSGFPLWNKDDFIEHRSKIQIPISHPFEKIWLLCGKQASDGVLQIA
jgi:hypothetical protein